MFLSQAELKSVLYEFQIDQITESDDDIVEMAIASAIEEVRSYLTSNFQHRFEDGRYLYDTEAIFNAEESERNALILTHTKTVAAWHVIQLCNADVIYEHVKERYDRAILWLRDLAAGKVTISTLPRLDPNEEGSPANKTPFRFGSRKKFRYE